MNIWTIKLHSTYHHSVFDRFVDTQRQIIGPKWQLPKQHSKMPRSRPETGGI